MSMLSAVFRFMPWLTMILRDSVGIHAVRLLLNNHIYLYVYDYRVYQKKIFHNYVTCNMSHFI